jgi:hypothetical protein
MVDTRGVVRISKRKQIKGQKVILPCALRICPCFCPFSGMRSVVITKRESNQYLNCYLTGRSCGCIVIFGVNLPLWGRDKRGIGKKKASRKPRACRAGARTNAIIYYLFGHIKPVPFFSLLHNSPLFPSVNVSHPPFHPASTDRLPTNRHVRRHHRA